MKYLTILILIFSLSNAKEYKAVFDCSAQDSTFIKSRMWLINETAQMMSKDNDNLQIALTLHGNCVPMVSNEYDMLVDEKDLENTKKAQEHLISLSKNKNIKIIACEMSLNRLAIEKDSVLPFVEISKNSIIDTIKYQNDGFALIDFK
jgi:intracellular sulfur oxidation DsrE/DsrF family protein